MRWFSRVQDERVLVLLGEGLAVCRRVGKEVNPDEILGKSHSGSGVNMQQKRHTIQG